MSKRKQSTSRLRETFYTAIVSSLTVGTIGTIVRTLPHLQRSGLIYCTNEVPAYTLPYEDNKFAPTDIQRKVLMEGAIKVVSVVVRNKGERASGALVRIPCASEDRCLGGWVRTSEGSLHHLHAWRRVEYRRKLLPEDAVRFYLYLGNVNSDIAHRIEVFDGDGRRATYYRYVPVRYGWAAIGRKPLPEPLDGGSR